MDRLVAIACIVLLVVVATSLSVAQSNQGGSSLSEIIFTQTQLDGRLHWFAQNIREGTIDDPGVFGQQGWDTLLAPWETPGTMTRTTVRRTELDQLFLGIPDRQEEVSLGTWPGRVVLNAGRDSNGNGTADALLVVERGRKLSWRFLFDPLTLHQSFKRILFGRPGNIPFLFRARGPRDILGIIVRNHIIYRGLKSSFKRRMRLSDYIPAKAPRTVRGRDGRDMLLFASENSGGLHFTIFNRNKKSEGQLNGTGTLFIGNVTGSGEETYGILKNSGELALISGKTFEVAVTGVLVSRNFQKSYQPEEISATPLPQPTSGFGVTIITIPFNTATPIPSITWPYL